MAVQLSTLHLLNRTWHHHYLLATAAALELTLVHNFVWHWHHTWRDRRHTTTVSRALIRFHLTNGLVSLVGNLFLMRLFVHAFHIRVLFANMVAIIVCSFANFFLAHAWSFASSTEDAPALHPGAPPPEPAGFYTQPEQAQYNFGEGATRRESHAASGRGKPTRTLRVCPQEKPFRGSYPRCRRRKADHPHPQHRAPKHRL
jgi:putative flippase GtrA